MPSLFLGDFASQLDQMVFAHRFYQPVQDLRTLNQEGKRLFAYLVVVGIPRLHIVVLNQAE
ncbi:hypothetical protein D3C80_1770490 [compost metagenome]